ncbi:MAG: hypothetical protein UX02_C0001G0056 [Candidatus Moranbacteria bacterium GW2011_GWC1_45_18]|nr:MAG: hypothetical protein UT79_C0002G0341 [Candidatus Moranbacteria bacterium GW2011_GWC2_40_12]KKT34180.1 MAG: hypothetical protein UW19_C0001G0075 [Candidatus Moranbacteria bacterium GW2011_GWF2_44_10]KKT70842.1 MAG: hypothetical protein UW66_C0036G0003 [Candidatus Moranbacteria bacterium GW2011_GWF1_44_4]KKU00608.1 MAG: hypothetical protein UX02_C0001G0056 [Candidatus Moranbacteria bacterium GW2011_GWC1_45_18]OGI34649.1 MAG: hypothetical protein A2407_05220 [Candidatus Moranbacteria bacte
MTSILLGAPLAGVLMALASVAAEQFLAVVVNIFYRKEIIFEVYNNLTFFLVASAIIEESFKYFSAVFILRGYFNLNRFKFFAASLVAGSFFGAAEIFLILLTNRKKIWDIGSLDSDTLFSLSAIGLLHILTFFLISALIASRERNVRFLAMRTVVPPAFIHLLFNFLVIQKGEFTSWLVGIVLGITFLINISIIIFNIRKLD